MNLKKYTEGVARTRAELASTRENNLHMILGMLTEAGELADVFKKDLAYGKQIDWVNVGEELGDLMWYIAGFCDINGVDLEQVLERNIEKLKQRYPSRFTENDAINRNLEKEREILEGNNLPEIKGTLHLFFENRLSTEDSEG